MTLTQKARPTLHLHRGTVTPRSRDGMVESLRVLKVCRKTAVQARRIALQIIQTTIVCAPDRLRDPLRQVTRLQLIRTLAAWRPDLTAYREVEEAYRISLKSLARRYLQIRMLMQRSHSVCSLRSGASEIVSRSNKRRTLFNKKKL